MAERLLKLFSSPKFKENKSYLSEHLRENVSPLSSSSRYNATQDEFSLDLDAKSDGFTSRICDTANSLLLGEFPWGADKQGDCITIKQRKKPKPVPVRLHIGPPNSCSLLLSEADSSEYENEEYNSSKSLIQALREISRKRTRSLMNEESDNDVDTAAAPKKACKPVEYRHNLYLSQLEEETQEYKNSLNNQSEQQLDRIKRGRDEDSTNANSLMIGLNLQDGMQNKRQRRNGDAGTRSPEERISTVISANDAMGSTNHNIGVVNSTLLQSNRIPRRGSNEIVSSLSSSLSLLDPAAYGLVNPNSSKNRRKSQKKVAAVETQTIETIPEEIPKTKEAVSSPKKEDKSINTDPVKPPPAVIQEKQVTDKMASSLMKSAVSKFLATEDPALSPVRAPLPLPTASPVEKPLPTPSTIKELVPIPVTTSNVLSSTSNEVTAGSTTLPPPTIDKPVTNTFNFGTSSNSTPNFTIPNISAAETISPFTFGSPSSNAVTTTSSSNLFTTPVIAKDTNILPKPSNTIKSVSFGDNKLGSFTASEINAVTNDEKNNKPAEVLKTDLFKTAEPSNTTASVTSTSSVLSKGAFSFGLSTSATPSTNSETLKTPTFTFGGSTSNFPATSIFGSTAEQPKTTSEQPRISLFGGTSTAATSKPEESKPLGAGIVNSIVSSGTFQFGSTNNDKKPDKPEEKKPHGLFGFGSAVTTPAPAPTTTVPATTSKPETKTFTFGASSSGAATEVTQASLQPAKPIFQFGSSSFTAPQTNITFGAKPSNEQTASVPSFGSPAGGLFGPKPATPSTSATATTTATTTTGLFGFGSVQPTATTTAPPTFGSSTSTTNSSVGGFSFQPNKPEEKPAGSSAGFAFKFTGTAAAPTAEPAKPSFNFGASNAQSTTPAFGASSLATQPTFGSVTPAASTFPAFSNPTPAPTFGTTPAAPTPAPTFGSTAPAPTFGAPAATTQPAPPVFGGVQTQQTPGPSFTFGAASVSNPSTGFNFGAPSQPPAQPASSGMFQFGSSANQQNPSGGVQPFQFNAGSGPAPAPNPQVGGSQPMFSIGSGSTAPRSRQLRRKK